MCHRGGGLAVGSTNVALPPSRPPSLCGFLGTTAVHGTSVFRDTGNGTFFVSGTFFAVFTAADSGKSAKVSFAGPFNHVAARDRRAGGDGHDHDYLRGSV